MRELHFFDTSPNSEERVRFLDLIDSFIHNRQFEIVGKEKLDLFYEKELKNVQQALSVASNKEDALDDLRQSRALMDKHMSDSVNGNPKAQLSAIDWAHYAVAEKALKQIEVMVTLGYFKVAEQNAEIENITKGVKQWLDKKIKRTKEKFLEGVYTFDEKMDKYFSRLTSFQKDKTTEDVIKKAQYLKTTYGFEEIILESAFSPDNQYEFLQRLDKTLKKICKYTGAAPKSMSFNGETSIAYMPQNMMDRGAGACALGHHMLAFSHVEEDTLMRHWIHEYTHALDAKAGAIYCQKNDKHNIFAKGLYLSSIIAFESSNGGGDLTNRSYLNNSIQSQPEDEQIKNKIGKMLGFETLSAHKSKSQDKLFEVREDMTKVVLLEILKESSIDYSSLTTQQKNLILRDPVVINLSRTLMMNAINNNDLDMNIHKDLIHMVIERCFGHESRFREVPASFQKEEIDAITNRLMSAGEKFNQDMHTVASKNNMIVFSMNGENMVYFSDSDYIKKSAQVSGAQYLQGNLYFTTPTELLARYTEKMLTPNEHKNDELSNKGAYPEQKEATKAMDLVKTLMDYTGLARCENTLSLPQPGGVLEKLKTMRRNILEAMNDARHAKPNV